MKKIGQGTGIALLLVLVAGAAWGGPTLVWDPNPVEEGVTEYTVHWGPVSRHDPDLFEGQYAHSASTGTDEDGNPLTSLELPFTEQDEGMHFAAVVAHNGMGLASDYSTEVTIQLDDPVTAGSSGGGGGGGCFLNLLSPPRPTP